MGEFKQTVYKARQIEQLLCNVANAQSDKICFIVLLCLTPGDFTNQEALQFNIA